MGPSRFPVVLFVLSAVLLALAGSSASQTVTFLTLVNFNGTDGTGPGDSSLIQGTDGNFYGTTGNGGENNYGTVFKVSPAGLLTTLYNFCAQANCVDGSFPQAGLLQATDGDFYGTTLEGGANDFGTVFKITSDGALTTLHSFDSTDGSGPEGVLIQANGGFYGTTSERGATDTGTVFKMSANGTLTTLYNFCTQTNCTDGADPQSGLVQATDGNFYGTTSQGGATNGCDCGTVFRITPAGVLTTLHSFAGNTEDDGSRPSGLVQGTDLNLYGTASGGGIYGVGAVFKITLAGSLTTIYSFCAQESQGRCIYGGTPFAGLVEGNDGSFYGTTYGGGSRNYGTVFKISPHGKLTTLWSFDSADGKNLIAGGLVQGSDGSLYGTTQSGGKSDAGTVFNLSVGLVPFVETQTTFGKVGSSVVILGTNLTGASSVTFNGTAAAFTVVSSSEITATVPTGATTGNIVVTTPTGPLTSNKKFRIVQ
jgi:uncharacterized repeat protein (TIGR03803 family)